MGTIINAIKESVSSDVHQPSSIIARVFFANSSSFPFNVQSTDATKHQTFIKTADGKTELRSTSSSAFSAISDMGNDNDGYIYVRPNGVVTPPFVAELEVYPSYNLKDISLNNLSELNEYMTHLEILRLDSYDNGSLIYPSCSGDISALSKVPSLVTVLFNTPYLLNPEAVTGDVGGLGNLVNLSSFNCGNALVYGDLSQTLDAMHENGRTSGELQFRCRSSKVVLTYNGTTIRVGPATATQQSDDVYGWRITFDSNGWTIAETYRIP